LELTIFQILTSSLLSKTVKNFTPIQTIDNPTIVSNDSLDIERVLKGFFPQGKIQRVLLVTPPDADASNFQFSTAKRGRYPNYPAYGLAVIAEKLREIGIEVAITNLNHEVLKQCSDCQSESDFQFDSVWQKKLDTDIALLKPDLVGVTCMFTMTHSSFKKVCERVKLTDVTLAIGGVHVTNDVDRVLDDIPCVDMAFLNEAEIAFQRMIESVNGGIKAEDLGQLIIVDGLKRHRIVRSFKPNPDDIDVIPAFDLLPMHEASNYGTVGAFYCFKPKETRFATVLSNRGCRAQCTFCSVRTFNGVGVRQRSIQSVVDELEILQNEYGVGHIMWLDDDLLKNHDRAIGLFNEMVKRNIGLTWDATNGLIASSCNYEVISAAAESGCIAVNIGMESGNPTILRDIKKPGRIENFIQASEVFKKFETIHVSVQLMLGFPGETMSMILDTINVARKMDMDWHRIAQLQPLPNTPIYDSMVAQGLIDAVGSKNVRFNGGAFGKQVEIEQGRQLTTPNFEEAFGQIGLDQVPNSEQLLDVWFYMNYHLNFHRLFTEKREVKIEQQFKHLRVLSDVISPENGFSLYFLGYLQNKFRGQIEPGIIQRLEKRLNTSPYWKDRFKAFDLSVNDLHSSNFKNKEIPRLLQGLLPVDSDLSPILGID
jgi:radical SAM superfamily enzyme YgiQ (UPF0313 family)